MSKLKTVRLFRSDFLESLTHVPVWIPAAIWLPVIGLLLWTSYEQGMLGPMNYLHIALAALLFWSLTEYLLHRFLFHAQFRSPRLQRMVFLLHGVHHDFPNDPKRLLMPPLAAIPIATAFWLLFRLVLAPQVALPFFAFFLAGYLIYDYIHYGTHYWRMNGSVGRRLKKNHMNHHFVDPDDYYGVSSPLWDRVWHLLVGR